MTIVGSDTNLLAELNSLNTGDDSVRVWVDDTPPAHGTCDIWVFTYTKGRCWEVVDRMTSQRKELNIAMVCCSFAPWGLGSLLFHCCVDSMGCKWLNNTHEFIEYLRDFGVKQ